MFQSRLKTVSILFLFSAIAAFAEDPPLSILLEKGIFAEETEGDLDKAIEIYRQITEKTDANREIVAKAHLRIGECYLELAKIQFQSLADQYGDQAEISGKAREQLAALGAEVVPVELDPLVSEDLAAKGWRLWQARKLDEAEGMFKKATQAGSENANAWNGLGWAQFNQGKPRAAKIAFEKCLGIEPQHPAALNGLGWIAKGEGKTEEAIEHWTKAIEASPNATAALNGLATTFMEQEEYEKAAEIYENWLKVEPDNKEAIKGLERAKKGKPDSGGINPGEFIEACEAKMKVVKAASVGGYRDKKTLDSVYQQFVRERNPKDPVKEETYDKVKEYLSTHEGDEDYRWRIHHLLSAIAADRGKSEEAALHLDRALETYPEVDYPQPRKHSKFQHLLNDRAGMIWDKEGVEAAEEFVLEQLKTNPKFEFIFWGWWEDRYKGNSQLDRTEAMLQKVDEAYQARSEKFPDKASQIEKYRQELER